MKLIPKTDVAELRKFYLLLAAAIVVMFYLVLPWLFDASRHSAVLYVAGAIGATGVAAPTWLYPLYRAWMVLARTLGWLNSRLLLGAAFYLMVLPVGLVARRLGKLGYRERPAVPPASYRIPRTRAPTREDLERPF